MSSKLGGDFNEEEPKYNDLSNEQLAERIISWFLSGRDWMHQVQIYVDYIFYTFLHTVLGAD